MNSKRRSIGRVKRVVVKVGTSSITKSSGYGLDSRRILRVAGEVKKLRDGGIEVVLVTSGAISAGMSVMGLKKKPRDVRLLQSLASVGQTALMQKYVEVFSKLGIKVGQVLLTKSDFTERERYLNARNTMLTLLQNKVLPIVNENDAVSVAEIRVGDNDNLSAFTACCIEADLLVMLSDIDGVYTCDPKQDEKAVLIKVVEDFRRDLGEVSGKCSVKGVGGMKTKVEAAKNATSMGINVVLANSAKKNVLERIAKGGDVGTLFIAKKALTDRIHWMKYSSKSKGKLTVDAGAKKILLKGASSLLPVGVVKVSGSFKKGDVVDIADSKDRVFAKGVSNYDASEVDKIKKVKSSEIERILGHCKYREVVYKGNLVVL